MTEILWFEKTKIFTIWPFTEKHPPIPRLGNSTQIELSVLRPGYVILPDNLHIYIKYMLFYVPKIIF